MSDPKPFEAVRDYGQQHMHWPKPDDLGPDAIEELLEKAENAHDPAHGLKYAQIATVRQLQKLTEQQTIANLIAVLRLGPEWADLVEDPETVLNTIREGLGL